MQGTNSGWFINPDTLNTFVDTEVRQTDRQIRLIRWAGRGTDRARERGRAEPSCLCVYLQAMSKSLRVLTELLKYSWPSSSCQDYSPYLWNGTCAITIASEWAFQRISMRRSPNPWRGRNRLVMTSLPGSHEVLDRQTGAIHQHIGYTLAWETAMHGGRHSQCSVLACVCASACRQACGVHQSGCVPLRHTPVQHSAEQDSAGQQCTGECLRRLVHVSGLFVPC